MSSLSYCHCSCCNESFTSIKLTCLAFHCSALLVRREQIWNVCVPSYLFVNLNFCYLATSKLAYTHVLECSPTSVEEPEQAPTRNTHTHCASCHKHTHQHTRYTHAHHVPHAEHMESSIGQNGDARSAVKPTQCCPLPIPLTGQRAK